MAQTIDFPIWVKTTKCKTRTFSTVLPKTDRYPATRHGAIKLVRAYPNRPVITVPRRGLPGFFTMWAEPVR